MISALYMAYARKQCHNNQVNNPLPLLEKKKKKETLSKYRWTKIIHNGWDGHKIFFNHKKTMSKMLCFVLFLLSQGVRMMRYGLIMWPYRTKILFIFLINLCLESLICKIFLWENVQITTYLSYHIVSSGSITTEIKNSRKTTGNVHHTTPKSGKSHLVTHRDNDKPFKTPKLASSCIILREFSSRSSEIKYNFFYTDGMIIWCMNNVKSCNSWACQMFSWVGLC